MINDPIDVTKCKWYDPTFFWHCMNPRTKSFKCKENKCCVFKRKAKLERKNNE